MIFSPVKHYGRPRLNPGMDNDTTSQIEALSCNWSSSRFTIPGYNEGIKVRHLLNYACSSVITVDIIASFQS